MTGNVDNYRAPDKQLSISPLPIGIDEYSGDARVDVEGTPERRHL